MNRIRECVKLGRDLVVIAFGMCVILEYFGLSPVR